MIICGLELFIFFSDRSFIHNNSERPLLKMIGAVGGFWIGINEFEQNVCASAGLNSVKMC